MWNLGQDGAGDAASIWGIVSFYLISARLESTPHAVSVIDAVYSDLRYSVFHALLIPQSF